MSLECRCVYMYMYLRRWVSMYVFIFFTRLRLYFFSGRAQDKLNRRQDRFSKQSLNLPQRAGDARPKRCHSAFGFQVDKRPRQQQQQQSQQQPLTRAQGPNEQQHS